MLNKDNLIQAIAKKVGVSKREAKESLDVILDEITKALSKDEIVQLPGFGKFLVTQRKERMGINPKTREKIKIPAVRTPKFRAGRILKEAVR